MLYEVITKEITMNYFLKMKAVCDSAQQEKLKEIFLTVSKSKEEVDLPQRGRRSRGGRSGMSGTSLSTASYNFV